MTIVNLHALETQNLGDRVCAPTLYFDLNSRRLDLGCTPQGDLPLIIGGGGLLHPWFTDRVLRHLEATSSPVVVWGVGTNTHGVAEAQDPEWLQRCDLVGLRDYPTSHRWVPCVSCMSPEFDRQERPSHRVVVYRHGGEPDNIPDRMGLPTLTNHAESLESVVDFLLSGEFVVTNTYHGMYWATLLKRRVIVYPFSSRHYHLKYRPAIVTDGKHWKEVLDRAQEYEGAVDECRAANESFFSSVKELIA